MHFERAGPLACRPIGPCPQKDGLYGRSQPAAKLDGDPARVRNDSMTFAGMRRPDRKVWYRRLVPAIIPETNRLVPAYGLSYLDFSLDASNFEMYMPSPDSLAAEQPADASRQHVRQCSCLERSLVSLLAPSASNIVPHKKVFGCLLQLLSMSAPAYRCTGSGNPKEYRGLRQLRRRECNGSECDFLEELGTMVSCLLTDVGAISLPQGYQCTPENFEPRLKPSNNKEEKGRH